MYRTLQNHIFVKLFLTIVVISIIGCNNENDSNNNNIDSVTIYDLNSGVEAGNIDTGSSLEIVFTVKADSINGFSVIESQAVWTYGLFNGEDGESRSGIITIDAAGIATGDDSSSDCGCGSVLEACRHLRAL